MKYAVSHPHAQLENALYLLMDHIITRYLMSCAHGRWDGAEKAQRHMELCQTFLGVIYGIDPDRVRRYHEDVYQHVHRVTQELTDNLDEQIGFPLESRPDYDRLVPLFFDKFLTLARQAVGEQVA